MSYSIKDRKGLSKLLFLKVEKMLSQISVEMMMMMMQELTERGKHQLKIICILHVHPQR